MSVPRTAATVLRDHVTLELEGIDRMYLNVYVPQLQRELGVVSFFRFHRGNGSFRIQEGKDIIILIIISLFVAPVPGISSISFSSLLALLAEPEA